MKKGILFVLAAAFLASCQQEEENGVVSSVDRVTITPIITRPQKSTSRIRTRLV